jgi:hypothetical protein
MGLMTPSERWPKQWVVNGKIVGRVHKTGTYYIRRRIGGKLIEVSTGCVLRKAADAEYMKFELNPAGYVNMRGTRAFKSRVRRGTADPRAYAKVRDHRLAKVYRMTEAEYGAMLGAQDGCCAVCGKPAAEAKGGVLDIDHCHATGAVRGLLCGPCNRGIGSLADSPERLRDAADYLERQRAP